MSHDEIDGDLGISRRQLIKRGAVVGGTVLWAAPVVQSLTTPALGQTLYQCQCNTSATALRLTGLVNFTAPGAGANCTATVNALGGTVLANVLCATAEQEAGADKVCNASAHVADATLDLLDLPRISAVLLQAQANAPCDCQPPTGNATIASVTIGSTTLTASGTVRIDALRVAHVAVNEQECRDGNLVVRAVHIRILTGTALTQDIVISEATARATNCSTC